MSETKTDEKNAAEASRLDELLGSPRLRISAERRAELIAEREEERRWHIAEIQDGERTLAHYRSALRTIEDEIAALKSGAA